MNETNIHDMLTIPSEYEMLQLDYDPHLASVDAMNHMDVI